MSQSKKSVLPFILILRLRAVRTTVGLLLIVLLFTNSMIARAQAQVVPPKKIFGDWDIAHVLLTRGLSSSPVPPAEGYARLFARSYSFERTGLSYGVDGRPGNLLTTYAKKSLSIKVLFEDEKIKRPAILDGDTLRKSAKDYALKEALGLLADRPITLYVYSDERFPIRDELAVMAFAAIGDVVLVPDTFNRNMLLVLQRAPKHRSPEHVAFCAKAVSALDKAVCANRKQWKLRHYIDTTTTCALSKPTRAATNLPKEISTALSQLNACQPDHNQCISNALDDHAKLIGSYIPPTKQCVNGEYKDLSLL